MSLSDQIADLRKRSHPPRRRAAWGEWMPHAWVVRGLVEAGHRVTDAVRIVIKDAGLEDTRAHGEASLRQAYYAVRFRPWPEAPKKADPLEGFEV